MAFNSKMSYVFVFVYFFECGGVRGAYVCLWGWATCVYVAGVVVAFFSFYLLFVYPAHSSCPRRILH